MKFGVVGRSFLNAKHILTIVATILCLTAATFLHNSEIDSLLNYSNFLSSRNFCYSVLVDKSLTKDSYAFFDRKITFSKNSQMSDYLNCEVLMETGNEHSADDFVYPFDSGALAKNEVAISKNLVKEFGVCVGDTLFSKHIVKNEIESYRIKAILPEIYGVKKTDKNRLQGLIITGRDQDYLSNISVDHLFCYKNDSSVINASNAVVKGSFVENAELRQCVNMALGKYVAITLTLQLAIVFISQICLYYFNKGIFVFKKRSGNPNTYTVCAVCMISYMMLIGMASVALYFLFSLLDVFSYVEMIMLLAATIIPNLILIPTFCEKLRRM